MSNVWYVHLYFVPGLSQGLSGKAVQIQVSAGCVVLLYVFFSIPSLFSHCDPEYLYVH
jgi:hypothetical protein